jgi:hypothetical protein
VARRRTEISKVARDSGRRTWMRWVVMMRDEQESDKDKGGVEGLDGHVQQLSSALQCRV